MHPPLEQSPALSALPQIRHGFFGRRGGVSEGEFASLNTSRSVGDDAANVGENIHRAVMALKAGPLPVALVRQVHGTDVLMVSDDHDFKSLPEADALVTARPGIALGILTADCVPVLLADPETGIVGAAHAGWKGATGGVLARVVEAMVALGASPNRISAAMGPAIAVEHYEIGPDMASDIAARFPEAAPFIVSQDRERPHLDIPGLVRVQAEALGLARIEQVGASTYARPDLYFSHRYATHNNTRAGRQIALIARG